MSHPELPDSLKAATRAVHAGRPPHQPDEPINTPITMASTFMAGGEREYGRTGNPTWTAFEDALGSLEGGRALSFASGMAAIATVLDLVANDAVVVLPRHSYTGTMLALGDLEMRGRAKTVLVDITDHDAVRAACEDAALMWLESPTNPAMEVADIATICEIAHDAGANAVVDNTFATPIGQNPLSLGADIVVHSATKFIAGHSDVLMGALVTSDDQLFDVLKGRRDLYGGVPGPFEAWLALRGLRTLSVRMERASANAAAIAERLEAHPAIDEVRYPGSGAMIAAVVSGGIAPADQLVRSTSLWVHTTSLGGVESSFERRRRWKAEPESIPDGLIRFSVGIEDLGDLWADLSSALDQLASSPG